MPRLNLDQLPAVLGRGLAPVYLVSGEEPLLVAEAADAIRAAARAAGYTDRNVFFIERGFDWDELRGATQSLSLFADRRIVELRLPSGKPDKGAPLLAALAANPPPDLLVLVITEKLDKKAGEAPWVQSFAQRGVWVPVWPVGAAALPAWLAARAKRGGVEIEPGAVELIAERVEGNLLAAQQELEKLRLLANGRPITRELVEGSVADSARYDVFQLAEAASKGDAARALRILLGLKSEGVEPTLILWALVRELRGLWQAKERVRLRSSQRGGWNQASTPSAAALARLRDMPLAGLLREASLVDRVVKGNLQGDPWTGLMSLTATLAGALQPTMLSGRVAS
ncbi:MAG: DNA polymerase III subunit delta [Steroidobacteraceae bacterium]|jgi:DNA polymerase-3 subunit delta